MVLHRHLTRGLFCFTICGKVSVMHIIFMFINDGLIKMVNMNDYVSCI